MKKCYLAGDMLNRGAQYLRSQEKEALANLGTVKVFNPMDNPINNKASMPLAERIFATDTEAILESEVIVFDISQTIGTSVEVGQVNAINFMLGKLHSIVQDANFNETNEDDFNHSVAQGVKKLLEEIPQKKVYWKTEDIRDHDNPESGYRRSHSYNAYLIGALLDVAGEAKKFDEILDELKEK